MTPIERLIIYVFAAVLGVCLGWWLAYSMGVTL